MNVERCDCCFWAFVPPHSIAARLKQPINASARWPLQGLDRTLLLLLLLLLLLSLLLLLLLIYF